MGFSSVLLKTKTNGKKTSSSLKTLSQTLFGDTVNSQKLLYLYFSEN